METGQIIAWSILIFIGGCFAIVLGAAFWSMLDHSKWSKNSDPSIDAHIVDIKTHNVQYVKNGAKYKTTVHFSDGFIFTSHKTNREDGVFSYRISISADLSKQIIQNAMEAHEKAVRKKLGKQGIKKAPGVQQAAAKSNSDLFSIHHQESQTPVQAKKKPVLPSWASWLLKPHNVVAIIGVIISVALNIYIPKEDVFYLVAAMGLMFVEYLLMAVINAIWGIPGKIFALLPYFAAIVLCIVVSLVLQNSPYFDGYDFLARIAPFAAAISLTMWVKHLWENL